MNDYHSTVVQDSNYFHDFGGELPGAVGAAVADRAALGGAAALDLFIGHLPYQGDIDSYRTVSRGVGSDLENWYVRQDSRVVSEKVQRKAESYETGVDSEDRSFVLKIQPFIAGGYEATIVNLDLEQIARSSDISRQGGKREKREQNENDIISSIRRAKKNVRLRIKNIGADRMITLTKRYDYDDLSTFWTTDEWNKAFYKFIRLCKKNGVEFPYVAVPEKHRKGAYHLHVAITGKVPVSIIRAMWYECVGGRFGGEVDISFRPGVSNSERCKSLAKYLTKYMSKQFADMDFNKKRYWHSKHDLPAVRRFILDARTVTSALYEFAEMFGLDKFEVCKESFKFDGVACGAWLAYDDKLLDEIPF